MTDSGYHPIKAKAINLGERLNLRALDDPKPLTTLPFTLAGANGGYTVLFRYGTVVFLDIPKAEQDALIEKLRNFIIQPYASPNSDEATIQIDPSASEGVQQDTIFINNGSLEALQVIAEILAKSLMLEYYESFVEQSVDATLKIIRNIKTKGYKALRSREVFPQFSNSMLSMHEMAGYVGLNEKAELLWDHPEYEKLYSKLEDEYEIRERYMTLDKKVDLIFRSSDTLMDLLEAKRSLRVEWYIVILIIVEIVLIVADLLHLF